jgi:hypothetical protein
MQPHDHVSTVHTHGRLTDHSFSSFNHMARPSAFLTDFDAAERLLDRRRTLGAPDAERPERRRHNLGGQNRLGAPHGRTTARTAAVAEMGTFRGLARASAAVAEMSACRVCSLMGSDGLVDGSGLRHSSVWVWAWLSYSIASYGLYLHYIYMSCY